MGYIISAFSRLVNEEVFPLKKQNITFLVVITCVFAVFLGGLFLGRVLYRADVNLSPLPQQSLSSPSPATASVNINTADEQALSRLPGIGETLAARIVAYREENGPFSHPEELLNVHGIGPSRLEAILDSITTGG